MSIKDYVSKIQNTCALIEATGSRISDSEKVEIVLGSLLSEFDAVLTLVSFSTESFSFQRLVDVLLEVERRQTFARTDPDQPLQAHFVKTVAAPLVTSDQGRPPASRERAFQSRVQCHICGRFGHLAQRCYYQFSREYVCPASGVRATLSSSGGLGPNGASSFGAPPVKGSHVPTSCPSNQWWTSPSATPSFTAPVIFPSVAAPLVRPSSVATPSFWQGRFSQNGCYDAGLDFGFGSHGGPRGDSFQLKTGLPRPPVGPSFFGIPSSHDRPHTWAVPNVGSTSTFDDQCESLGFQSRDHSNCVQFLGFGDSGFSPPCIGLSRLPDLHSSNISNSTGFDINSTNFGTDSYIPVLVGTSTWYPDSGATHHICRDSSALNEATPYSGTSPLLMGDGTPAQISHVGSSMLSTSGCPDSRNFITGPHS
ncbi:uncharacterized protein LOC105798926 isoform X2 [Gossypium raimondii]|uniref:uncharacterized protein LOC105798926 isoform X2 n=1 Tax=Gossypium raimondii TaxID=29730 RepID=UPI00063A8E11|nr:uncharacterized protein LOC105798926 isoform X2 [Gossypium raimondii]